MTSHENNSLNSSVAVRYLLAIQTMAGLAQWLDIFLIFSVPSFLWKSSPGEIAFLASCFGLPSLFLGPFLGVLLDRSDPRKVMMFGILARTVLSVMIAFAPGFPSFAALVLFKGLANLLYWPASSIVCNHVVWHTARVKYFSSQSAFDQMTKIGTPLIAGILAMAMDQQLAFLVSAAVTLVCAAMLPRLNGLVRFTPPAQKRSVNGLLGDLFLGLRSIKTLPSSLLLSMGLGIGMSLALAIYDPHLAAFLGSKGFDAGVFAIVVSATGVGAVVGAALIRFSFNESTPIKLIRVGVAIFATAVAGASGVMAFAPQLLGRSTLFALWFLNGLGYEVFVIGCSVNTQNLCPQALLGRINTSVRSLQMLAVVLGPGIGAWLIAARSREAPFVASSVLTLVLLGIAATSGRWIRRTAAPKAAER
jgi:MFS family permease